MITTLTGPNTFLMQQELQKQIAEFKEQNGDFGLEKLHAAETSYEKIQEAVQSIPFLSPAKMVVIDQPSSNKELAEHITDLLESANEATKVLLVETKFDKRSSLYKTLKKQTEFIEFAELDERALAQWVRDFVREAGGSISASDSLFLVQRTGIDQVRLKNELDKLLAYGLDITKESIGLLVELTPQGTVFNLLDAAFEGNLERALRLYDEQRSQKVEPQAILAMLGWQLHVLSLVKTASNRSPDTIAKEAKLNPFVVKKSTVIARRITLPQLRDLIDEAVNLDLQLKTKPIDADEALKNLLVSIAKD